MKRCNPVHVLALVVVALLGVSAVARAQQDAPTRGIVNVTGQLYRAQNNNHYTVFLVTPDGIIMSDPINRDFALWLKRELATRYDQPVRYVLYTHHHWDHASGGAVFADTAEFIGHQTMPALLEVPAGNLPLPEAERKADANGNGLVERGEAAGTTAQRFDLFDANRDGVLSGAELARGSVGDVFPPTRTFADSHAVTVGGKRVEMVHLGAAHSPDGSVIHFPDERAVFGADTLQVRRIPGGLAPTVGDWIDAMKTVMAIDFDHALTGHALSGTRADIGQLLQFFEDLSRGVAAGIGAGRTVEEIQQTLTLDAYRSFERWDTLRAPHIASVYATMKGTR